MRSEGILGRSCVLGFTFDETQGTQGDILFRRVTELRDIRNVLRIQNPP